MKQNGIVAAAVLSCMAGAVIAGCSHKASGGGAGRRAGPPPVTVTVQPVKLGTIAQTTGVTGNIAALDDSTIAARVTARVDAVYVREGDYVHAGQVIVQQDVADLQDTVRSAEANLNNARAQLAQNITNYQIQVTNSQQAVLNAQASLNAARYQYSKELEGNRPPQILEAQTQVDQARANVADAQVTLKRDQYLYSQGALDAADLDTAQTTYNVDVQQYNNAQANYKLTVEGNYPQDIAYYKEQVAEQVTNLKNQVANLKQIRLHKQEIQAAEDTVIADKETVANDIQQVKYATVTAPFDGYIAARDAQPGQVASAGTNLIEVVNVKTCYFQPTLSQEFFNSVGVGNPVVVQSDALPGRTFMGHVAAVYPSATTSTRVFSLRVDIPNPSNELRPGMYARGQLTTSVQNNVVVIPQAALITISTTGLLVNTTSNGNASGNTQAPDQEVMLAETDSSGKTTALAQPVTVGMISGSQAEITSGLKPGDPLIVNGGGLVTTGQTILVEGRHRRHPGQGQVAANP